MARKNRAGLGCGGRLIGVALIVVVLAVAAEFGARWYLADRIETEVSQHTGAPTDISFGLTPVLPGLVTDQTVGTAHLSSPASDDTPALEIDGHDARTDGTSITVASIDGTATVTQDQLATAITREAEQSGLPPGLATIRSVTPDAAAGVLRIDIAGVADVAVAPGVVNGKLFFDPQQAEILGMTLPDQLFSGITTLIQATVDDLPDGIGIDSARIVDSGLEVTLVGSNVHFEQ